MSEKNEYSDRKGLEEDDLIKQLIPDPNNPDVNVLVGAFLGRGTDEKTIRLYTTLKLDQYFQLPKDKVLGVKRFSTGEIVVWIPGDLRVLATTSNTLSGDFLKGSIQSSFSRRGGGGLGSLIARLNQAPPPSAFGGPFCKTDIPDPSDPTCGLTQAGCPPGPGC
jgi:hypothetical protein